MYIQCSRILLAFTIFYTAAACQNTSNGDGAGEESSTAPGYQGKVSDLEEILTKRQEAILKQKIDIIEKGRNLNIAVITVEDIPDSLGTLQYAVELGNRWEIGGEEGNALVVLVSAKEGQTGIAVGRRLEQTYTDEVTGRIISKEMLPYFRTGYYQQGLMNMLNALAEIDPVRDSGSE